MNAQGRTRDELLESLKGGAEDMLAAGQTVAVFIEGVAE